MSNEYRFQVGRDDGTVVTLAAMLDANASDEGFCEWARNARPGDEFPDGEGCICLGSRVMFNPLAAVFSAIDNVRRARAADEAAVSLVALQAGALAALAASRANPTPATRAAAVAASAALSAATLPPKARGYSNRAGRRQHDEQHARTAEAMRRRSTPP